MNPLEWFGNGCSVCGGEKTGFNWCRTCNAKHFKQNFKNWTSGNKDIDKFIQEAQLSASEYFEVLEWVPYEKFHHVEFIAKGGFGKVYKAIWTDGLIRKWDEKKKDWERICADNFVALKCLDNSEHVSLEFINEITCQKNLNSRSITKLYGITKDPETKNYMMILEYAENGNLREYLNKNTLNWENKIRNIHYIALGLEEIHKNGLIHRDLHIGNILMNNDDACITDLGLCRPADHDASDKKTIYGVLYYIDPEVLRGKNYTKASDIYSFGIVMYEIISGLRPYYELSNHNEYLSVEICRGLRPQFIIKIPPLILQLYNKCLDADPLKRPTADEISLTLSRWWQEIDENLNNPSIQSELIKQIREEEKFNKFNNPSTSGKPSNNYSNSKTNKTSSKHSNITYSKPIIVSDNLSKSKNSNFSYKYDNMEMESLRIDINAGNISTG